MTEELQELTADYTKPKKRTRKPTAKEPVSPWDEYLPTDTNNAVVRIYKWKSRSGWYWEMKIPVLSRHWETGKLNWIYQSYSGYCLTKVGARYSVNKAFRQHERTSGPNGKIEFSVPLVPTKQTGARTPLSKVTY